MEKGGILGVFASLRLSGFLLLAVQAVLAAELASPEAFLGFRVGAEKKLARWDRIVAYMRLAARESDRVDLVELGESTGGNPFIMAVVSSPANLRNLDALKAANRRLFDPRTIASESEAEEILGRSRLFLLVTCSIHATEIGASQAALELVHRLATDNSPRIQQVLDNVVLLLVPSLNPDGQILVTDWYNRTVGTPNENAPLPWLYHPYVGHDNNRDAYMFSQKETRLIGKVLFQDWLPAVWLDQHQMGSAGARIFVMPAMDPINPNVDPVIYRHAGLLGFAQAAALEKAGKTGIIYGSLYTYWWEGAMAWTGWWHNMVGMLTEVASARIATTIEQERFDPARPRAPILPEAGGTAASGSIAAPVDVQSRSEYPRPWLGGRWSLRDIVDYELISTFGLLETAGALRVSLLEGLVAAGRRQIDLGLAGNPFAIVVPLEQPDRPTVVKLLETLALGGVELHRAEAAFTADGIEYPAGTYVIQMAQPFRGYAKDLLEPQVYPKLSPAPGVPPRPPYDVAGWSLGMQMGVETVFVKRPFEARLRKVDRVELPPGRLAGEGSLFVLPHEPNNSLRAVNRLLDAGNRVEWLLEPARAGSRILPAGSILVQGGRDLKAEVVRLTAELGIDAAAAPEVGGARSLRLRAPRIALYQPWGGSMDEGWTRWLLEQYEFPYTTVRPADVRTGDFAGRFDAVVFADMSPALITGGLTAANVPAEYRGGIEETGIKNLRTLMDEGGTVVLLGSSTHLAMERFAAPFRDALRGLKREEFFCPGSILRVSVDNAHPIGFGMKEESNAYFANSIALDPVSSFATMRSAVVVRFPSGDLLRSGWLQGESHLHDRVGVAEVRLGKGRMVLLPLRVQHRGQSHGTFKLLFNSLLTSAVEPGRIPSSAAGR
jgi:hypothetical protein